MKFILYLMIMNIPFYRFYIRIHTSGNIKLDFQMNISIKASFTIALGVGPVSCLNRPIELDSIIRFFALSSHCLVNSSPSIPKKI
jgi:hypothetical protein